HQQTERHLNRSLTIFPYSIRPGYERLRSKLDETLLSKSQHGVSNDREAILTHKLVSLTNECVEYLTVSLVSAETADSEKEQLRLKILGQNENVENTRTALNLIVRSAAGATRSTFEKLLRKD